MEQRDEQIDISDEEQSPEPMPDRAEAGHNSRRVAKGGTSEAAGDHRNRTGVEQQTEQQPQQQEKQQEKHQQTEHLSEEPLEPLDESILDILEED